MKRLGKSGADLYEKAQGIGSTAVIPNRAPKSCSAEDTFASDTSDLGELKKWLLSQSEEVGRDLRKHSLKGKTITLKVKFSNFKTVTRSTSLPEATHSTKVIYDTVLKLLKKLKIKEKVRIIGVGASNFAVGMEQRGLFPDPILHKHEDLDRALDQIQNKYGPSIRPSKRSDGFAHPQISDSTTELKKFLMQMSFSRPFRLSGAWNICVALAPTISTTL